MYAFAGTKAARKLPPNFSDVKTAFLKAINDTITKYEIPHDLVINWDQTGKFCVNLR